MVFERGHSPRLLQERNAVDRRWLGERLQVRIEVRRLLIIDDLGGVGRHFPGRLSNIGNESRVRDRVLIQTRPGYSALSFTTVALETADLHEQCFAGVRVAFRWVGLWCYQRRQDQK